VGGAAAVRDEVPGIRRPAVERFFAERVPGSDGPLRFALISGGRSNLTYLVERETSGGLRSDGERSEHRPAPAEQARAASEVNS